ncbi:hypothetical protein ACOMICROBIO_NCLOACGD_01561 [Vibrio sp. B1ASS3]|uniref:hypothetical protein n=1 Tax=Vibrio sp. B1ASS3 TaxID=2751176 RepID=UPI001ABB3319|nr:hypothetical protein [Vibrio sp. B1ASS3]CAD7806380.1 hypothetical protein ACOMICROBIO_NCLOACGD_01561 [Vibrio sp. B1ASS3]CAE6901860.1 hypothetical protein ACOMICROBIO_NCLOACGD_01561 [Vibrio sp. B1ASS3]
MKLEYWHTFSQGLVFTGAIISALGALGVYYWGGKVSEAAQVKMQTEIKNAISEKSKEIKQLTEHNLELSKINADLSRSIHSQTEELTARGSYPFGNIAGGDENGNKTQITIDLIGQYAITNLMISITTIPDYSNVNGLNVSTLGLNSEVLGPDILRTGEFKYFLVDTPTKETAILLQYKSNNRTWNQSFRIVKTENGRKVLSVLKDSKGVTLKKRVDSGFPQKNGKYVLWSNIISSESEL